MFIPVRNATPLPITTAMAMSRSARRKATRPGAPSGMLVFDIELLDFAPPPAPPVVPPDVKAPPKNATKTESGLAYVVLKKGEGTEHPAVQGARSAR